MDSGKPKDFGSKNHLSLMLGKLRIETPTVEQLKEMYNTETIVFQHFLQSLVLQTPSLRECYALQIVPV